MSRITVMPAWSAARQPCQPTIITKTEGEILRYICNVIVRRSG